MNILIIGPYPEPITGNSLAVKVLDDHISKFHFVLRVDLSKKSLFSESIFNRIKFVFSCAKEIYFKKKNIDVIYLTIAESPLGMLRDILFYIVCYDVLSKFVIHLHGGNSLHRIQSLRRFYVLNLVNSFFVKRLRRIIILGDTQTQLFRRCVKEDKVSIVQNFAENFLFTNERSIRVKFNKFDVLNISFISNMILSKGYMEILEAYILLPDEFKVKVKLYFAGMFQDLEQQNIFLHKISELEGVEYLGVIKGNLKRELFQKSHVICLPTYYINEGQPITIIEAYASGCYVVTTDHSGIKDIFIDGLNGKFVEKASAMSLMTTFKEIILDKSNVQSVAIRNFHLASNKYTTFIHLERMESILCYEKE